MKKIVIITDGPSPYRVDHYKFLQNSYKEYEFHIVFSIKKSKSELRQWETSAINELKHVHYLPNYTILIKKRFDNKQTIITHGVGKVLKQIVPDAVICMEYNPTSIQTIIWCKKNKVPFISLTDGTLHSERNINKVQFYSRKFIMKYADAFIASSTKAKEKIESYTTKKKIFISYLSEDQDKYLQTKIHNNGRHILYVGSLIKRKGIDLLLNVLIQIKEEWELNIAGTGPLLKELQEQAQRLGISDRVHFCGYQQVQGLVNLYQNADLFVLPTREDCYGLVIMEAMCASLPVVVSKYADGAYDLVEQHVTGLIVDPENIEEFAKAIDIALKANKGTNKWGLIANERIRRFSFDYVSVPFVEAIRYVLNRYNNLE